MPKRKKAIKKDVSYETKEIIPDYTGIKSDVVIVNSISEITNDLGRGDLNELRDKINEIIRFIAR